MLSTCLTVACLLALSLASIRSFVLYSQDSPSFLVSELSEKLHQNPDRKVQIREYSESVLSDLEKLALHAIFDYTFSVVYSLKLKQYCSSHRVLYFSPKPTPTTKWTFLLHPFPQTEASALDSYIKYLNWTSFHLLISEKYDTNIKYDNLNLEEAYIIPSEGQQKFYDHFTGRVIKPSGNWKSVILSTGEGVSKHVQSLENLHIYEERCVYITNSEGSIGEIKEGGLSIVEEGLEGAKSEGEYEYKAIERALNILEDFIGVSRTSVLDNEVLLEYLEEISEDRVISTNYSIVNFTPLAKIVGTVYKNKIIENGQSIVYPGNVTEINSSPPIIHMSANLGYLEYDGTQNLINYILNLGVKPMVEIINNDPALLKNFKLQLYSTDCGQTYFNAEITPECLKKHYPYLGAFYINTMYQDISKGYIKSFRENNITIPHLVPFHQKNEFYDKDIYPELFVTAANQVYIYSILPYILNSFRWNQILVFFQDTQLQDLIDLFFNNARALNIEIMNDEDHMFIPWTFSKEEVIKSVRSMAQYLYDTECRIFIFLMEAPYNLAFLEALYDFGFRKGEIVAVNLVPTGLLIDYEEYYQHNKTKVLPLIDGSISLFNPEFIGEYGKELKHKIGEMVAPFPPAHTCYQIDSLLLGVHTVELMLQIGRDYNDPDDLSYFMRQERFTGCSGTVSIDSRGNGRNELSFSLYNFYVEEGESWKEEKAGYYTIGINFPLNISKEIVWPKGETVPPSDMRISPKCGFAEDQRQYNQPSRVLLIKIVTFYFVLSLFIGFTIWWKFFNLEYEELSEEKEMWFEDFVVLVLPIIEALQFVALGPKLEKVNPVISFIAAYSSINLEFSTHDFWILIYVFLSGVSLWIVCVVLFLTTCYKRLCNNIKKLIVVIGYRLAPLFSNVGLIPIVFTLLRLVRCKEGSGKGLTDSFLYEDCALKCWEGFHLGISIFGLIVLFFYSVSAITMSVSYEYLTDYSHLKTSTLFSFLKTALKLFLVLLNFHLKEEFPLIYAAIYFLIFALWTILGFKMSLSNYPRFNFWQRMILIGLSFYFLSMLLYESTGKGKIEIMICQWLLILVLIGIGGFVQYKYYPSMLYRKKGRNFDKLLKFAFRWDMDAKELTEHRLDYYIERERSIVLGNRSSRNQREYSRIVTSHNRSKTIV